MIKYSASMNAFFDTSLAYLRFPPDLVEVTDERHAELLTAQTAGQQICAGPDGEPIAMAPAAIELTTEQRTTLLLNRVVQWLDAPAKARGYDDIKSAALRAAYPGPYHAEGVAFAMWMDEVYAACYALLAQFQAGELPEPTAEELLAMLPALALPAPAV